MCAVSESGRGTRIHVIHVAAACLAYFCCGLTGALCTPGASTGQFTDRAGGGQARRERDNLKREISWWRPRPGPARETVVSCDSYFDPVAFVYCVGFWGSVHFFRLSRNGYFKIESRPDARLTLPRPNTIVFGVFCARSYAHSRSDSQFRQRSLWLKFRKSKPVVLPKRSKNKT